jgi:hypothetical protein
VSPIRNKRFPRRLTLFPDTPELRAKSRTNFVDPGPEWQPNRSMMACSQIDYYRSGTTIAAIVPFNQAATIRDGFPPEPINLSFEAFDDERLVLHL